MSVLRCARSFGRRNPWVKAGIFSLVAFCALIPSRTMAGSVCKDGPLVERAGGALIAAARAESAENFASALKTYGDMDAIALFALGRYRKKLPPAQREEFVALTVRYIAVMLHDFRRKFRAQSLTIENCTSDTFKTSMFFLGPKGNQPVLWRVKNGKIVDVNIQHVWLAQLLRDRFSQILSLNGYNLSALFTEMRKTPSLNTP